MEKATVIALLEKYFEAGTSVAEEKALAEYFRRQDDFDPDLTPYRDVFLYFGQEAQVNAGPDFESRILEHVGLARRSARAAKTFHLGFIAAAASICAIVASLFLLMPAGRQGANGVAPIKQAPGAIATTTIRDTYEDPAQALAAVRHALLIASTHLNEGRRSITGPKR
jgi:hypothetical protein